jgi:hypothetical protein
MLKLQNVNIEDLLCGAAIVMRAVLKVRKISEK